MTPKRTATALIAALALAGCGGGGGGGDAVGNNDDGLTQEQREDRDASASVGGLMAFVQALIGGTSDSTEPRSIAGVDPPVDDRNEPSAL